MSIPTQCGACGHTFQVKHDKAGRLVACKACREPVRVPNGEDSLDSELSETGLLPELVTPPRRRKKNSSTISAGAPPTTATPLPYLQLIWGSCALLMLFVVVVFAAFQLGRQSVVPNEALVRNPPAALPAPQPQPKVAPRPSPPSPVRQGPVVKATPKRIPSTVPAKKPPRETASTPPRKPTPAQGANPPATAAAVVEPATPPSRFDIVFEPLPLEEPATSFAMTEEGTFLVITHQSANLVSIYDILQQRIAQTITVDAPRAVICRDGRAFLTNYPLGTITVLSESKDWARSNELQVDHPHVKYLSAAGGRLFQDELLVTCHPEGPKGSYEGPKVFLLDVKQDKCRLIGAPAMATVSYDGKLVLTQGSFNLSPSGGLSAYPYSQFISTKGQPIFRGGIQQTPYVYQVHAGGYWLATNMVFGGAPINQVQKDVGGILIPDYAQKTVYALSANTLSAYALNVSFSELGKRKVQLPELPKKDFSRIGHLIYRHRDYLLDHPTAYTHDETLSLFVLDMKDGAILAARTPAFTTSPSDKTRTEEVTTVPAEEMKPPAPSPSPAGPSPTEPARSTELTASLPPYIVDGQRFVYQLPDSPAVKYELMSGPPGLTISPQGAMIWTPTAEHVGRHELKIRVTQQGREDFERPSLEVVDRELLAAADGDLARINQLDHLDLDVDTLAISRSSDGKSLLVLQGDKLRVLGANGITVAHEQALPLRYHDIKDRGNVYVALSHAPPALDVFDKQTGKRLEHHLLEPKDLRILEITDFAIHPTRPESYIAIKFGIELPRYMVICVNERTGHIDVPGILGTYVEIDPQGQYLYTGYKDLYQQGSRFHINPNWQLLEIPQYGNVDMLISWKLDRGSPRIREVIRQAGGNGSGIRLSPDGTRLTYLSHVGYPLHSGNLAGFQSHNFSKTPVAYATKDRGVTSELAYHPTLPWAASPGSGSAVLFQRETGEILERRLLVTSQGIGRDKVERLEFSPDGQSLIFCCQGGQTGRYLCRVGIKLNPQEREQTQRPIKLPAPTPNVPKPKIAANELEALSVKSAKETLTPKDIGKRYLDAVVVVQGEDSSGTGFVIGKQGYILTCAHVVPEFGETEVLYNISKAGQTETVKTKATVLYSDEDRDIALLKIQPRQPLTTVVLHDGKPVETGEEITVIGNPGLGATLLTHTMTTGIVSNPRRELDGQQYLQTSAAVNPGNSGGPMFDSHGAVVGIVSLKGNIEGAGFAIPATTIRQWLKDLESPSAKSGASH